MTADNTAAHLPESFAANTVDMLLLSGKAVSGRQNVRNVRAQKRIDKTQGPFLRFPFTANVISIREQESPDRNNSVPPPHTPSLLPICSMRKTGFQRAKHSPEDQQASVFCVALGDI